jgi:hypothetical protein
VSIFSLLWIVRRSFSLLISAALRQLVRVSAVIDEPFQPEYCGLKTFSLDGHAQSALSALETASRDWWTTRRCHLLALIRQMSRQPAHDLGLGGVVRLAKATVQAGAYRWTDAAGQPFCASCRAISCGDELMEWPMRCSSNLSPQLPAASAALGQQAPPRPPSAASSAFSFISLHSGRASGV